MQAPNLIDFYKFSHHDQYPEKTTKVYANFTPRAPKGDYGKDGVIFFGLQYAIIKYLDGIWGKFFQEYRKDPEITIWRYNRRMTNALGQVSVKHMEELGKLGYLPILIKALPEGTRVPFNVPMFTIENTDPRFAWITNYLETLLSAAIWYPCTTATIASDYRRLFEDFAIITGGDINFCSFQGHDFSFRGISSPESAAIGGAGHLLSFQGTDTVPAIDLLEEYYSANSDRELVGCSVPASEHSVASMYCFEKKVTQVEEEYNEETKTWQPIRYF